MKNQGILNAFHLGQVHALVNKYANPFNKKTQRFSFRAYRNGFYGKGK